MIQYLRDEVPGGVIGDGYTIYDAAWCECKELQCSDRFGWVTNTLRCVADDFRIELGAWRLGELVGGMVLQKTFDPHVGDCLAVLFQYVKPEFRNQGVANHFFKMAIKETQTHNLPILAYTHRLGDWKYKTTYRRV